MKEIKIKGMDGLELATYVWDNVVKPKGVLLIIHGMQEHARRYAKLAEFLNKNNYIVVANDLRGHGKNVSDKKDFGYDEGDIFAKTVQDELIILKYLDEKYKLPIVLLGHSYGSFITQRIITLRPKISKAVLSGSAYMKSLTVSFGKVLSYILGVFNDGRVSASAVEKLSLKKYSKGFEDGNWLSRDPKIWELYKKDEFCGMPFPVNFYKSLFKNILKNYNNLLNADKTLPILLIGGSEDPVSSKGKALTKLYSVYSKAKLNVSIKIYPGARHEVINETNKDEVYGDILHFMDS